jgi:hypothetical protein
MKQKGNLIIMCTSSELKNNFAKGKSNTTLVVLTAR